MLALMEEWQKDGFDQLEKRGYLPKLRELAMNMCAPFLELAVDGWSSQGFVDSCSIR